MRIRSQHPSGAAARAAIAVIFLVTGFVAGSWFGRIPAVTDNLGLDKGQIGSLILFLSLGSLVAFQAIGRVVSRFGSARTSQVAAAVTALTLSLLALAPNPLALGAALFAIGAAVGSTGVAMNAQGVVVQNRVGRPILNSLHGCFTLGTLAGSALGGLLAHIGIGPVPHFLAVSVVGAVAAALAGRYLLADGASERQRAAGGLALPPRALWPLGVLALCAGLAEGSMYDWSALYVHDDLGASETAGSIAFATFSLAMLAGRFSGDRIVERLGPVMVVRFGGVIAGTGLLAGLATGTVAGAFVGFALLGIGLSVLMPLFYGAGGSHPDIPSVQGVAAVATMGFLGLLAGPPLLGTLAEAISLRTALGVVVVLGGVIALLAGTMRPAGDEEPIAKPIPERVS